MLASDEPGIAVDWHALPNSDIDQLVRIAFGSRAFDLRRTIAKFMRYGATSVICFGISEIVLLIAAGFGIAAIWSAAIGTVSGVIPSYLLSRYWIWKEAERERPVRQVVMYWVTSAVALVITSLTTGGVGAIAPASGFLRLVEVGVGYFVINAICFVGKYFVYQRFVFVSGSGTDESENSITL